MKSGQDYSSNPFVNPEKSLLCNISYLKDIFPDPQYSFSFPCLLSMMLHPKRLFKLFLADNLQHIGAKQSPAHVAISAPEKQTIGFISLRLAPPIKIRRLQDVRDVFLNHEFLRLVMLIAWLVFCGFIETFMAQLSDIRYHAGPSISKHPLRDLLHDAFPLVADTQIVNYLLTTTIVYTVAGFAIQSPDWTTRFMILRRWAFIMGFIYVFRGITLLVTTLPSSLIDECRPPEIELTGTVAERFGFIMSVVGGTALTCTDNIFSGHTSMMMSCCMIWRVHSRLRRPFGWILYSVATAGILMILFTRFHYSIDVVLAIYITYTAWDIYLRYIQEASMRYMFGFTNHSTLDLFNTQIHTADAARMYEYLNWQPHPLGKKWMMWFFMYVDGLDIRLRALRIFDENGVWQQKNKPASMTEKKHSSIQPIV
ncbi:hypothetical protein INT46_002278 [Mucor plumbeus]|uniref:Sphingomyelin synthase-like domain-containing protein n=1 Tax=Mucor plumbeus TaxID=97098 RepID=A0A8H7RM42_9FUNG|nr:hypothetical protein INT46_002278 [Mucor plumbeus]